MAGGTAALPGAWRWGPGFCQQPRHPELPGCSCHQVSEEGKGWDHLGTGFGFLRAHLQRGLQGGSHCAWAEYEEMVGMGLLHKEEK